MTPLLSIIIPCYNEERTLVACIERVLAIADDEVTLDVVIVDDCSRDNSLTLAHALAKVHAQVRVFAHDHNQGKGAALKSGIRQASGKFVTFQDADLEYDPQDLKQLLLPLMKNEADVVYGSRLLAQSDNVSPHIWHIAANRALTVFSNLCTGFRLTDMETCYKMFPRAIIEQITIREKRFGVEPELTAKLARLRVGGRKLRVAEVPIRYRGRSYEEGKKIGFKDGLRALYCSIRYSFFSTL